MTKKSKTKKQVRKVSAPKAKGHKQYEAHYLAIILIGFLLLEGILFTATNFADWKVGASVLDMSTAMSQTVSDLGVVMQPIGDAIEGVNEFYQLSALAMMDMLDLSDIDPFYELGIVLDGVHDFYQEAAVAMASVLDVSDTQTWPARVAGVSFEVR